MSIFLLLLLLPIANGYDLSGKCDDDHDCLHAWHYDVFDGIHEHDALKANSPVYNS